MKAREPRQRVTTAARMRTDAGWSDVAIRDISSRGVGLRCAEAPRRGTYIELCRHHHKLIGRVVWSDGERFGVLLSDSVVVEDLLSSRPPRDDSAGERRRAMRQPGAVRPGGSPQVAVVNLLEDSRRAARFMNFVAVVAIACLGAAAVALLASSVLAEAMSAVSAGLSGSVPETPGTAEGRPLG